MNDLEYRERIALEADFSRQFEYLCGKEPIAGNTPQALILAFKEVALKWYLRGRFND